MDFSLSSETQRMVQVIREFMRNEVYPLEQDYLNTEFRQMLPRMQAMRARVKAMGLWLPQISEEYGGQGLSLLEFASVGEELGRSPLGHYLFNCQAPDAGNMEILIQHGTRTKRAVPAAARPRRTPQLLFNDRAGLPRLESDLDEHHGGQGWRGLPDQRG
jgi:alkylation response protein AidB-like acyl-CoA dehydrogenase